MGQGRAAPEGAGRRGPDWLSPTAVMAGVFGIYIGGRLVIGKIYHLPLFWGGSARDEVTALALVIAFAAAVTAGVWLAPKAARVTLSIEKRSQPAQHLGRFAALGYVAIGLFSGATLVRRLGGLGYVLQHQAALASQIKELGLGPLYGLFYLHVIACLVLAFQALVDGRRRRALLWFLCVVAPSALLGRRVMILFVGLPLLACVHYHIYRFNLRRMLVLGTVALVAFSAILLIRLRSAGTAMETVGTSLEFALYDALVAAVARRQDLQVLGLEYFFRHPDEFWGANTAALFLNRISGFQWTGGATPPTAVGTLWIYFGTTGLLAAGVALGWVLGRARREAANSMVGALLYGFALFYWFDFLRNGDIVLEAKLFLRYAMLLLFLLSFFYRVRLTANVELQRAELLTAL